MSKRKLEENDLVDENTKRVMSEDKESKNIIIIDFSKNHLPDTDLLIKCSDEVTLYFYKSLFYSSYSKKLINLINIKNIEKDSSLIIQIPEKSDEVNWLLNWFYYHSTDAIKWLKMSFEDMDWKYVIHQSTTAHKWGCFDLLWQCYLIMTSRPLPWPIVTLLNFTNECNINDGVQYISRLWVTKVNKLSIVNNNNKETIIGELPSKKFWDECVSSNPLTISPRTLLRCILPNIDDISKTDFENILSVIHMHHKNNKQWINNLLKNAPLKGVNVELIKHMRSLY
jgi:hypothetical protein